MTRNYCRLLTALAGCVVLIGIAAPAEATPARFGGFVSPYHAEVGRFAPAMRVYPPGYIDQRWENNPWFYWRIHHRWPYPIYPPYPWPYPYPVPDPVPMYLGGPTSSGGPIAPPLPQPSPETAHIRVFLPYGNARVTFDGHATSATGTSRLFETPPLKPDKTYQYTLTATWNANGRPVTQQRTVNVRAGQISVADFTVPAPADQIPAP